MRTPSVGVGQTALFVAWMRQLESERDDALFRDPLAAEMLSALSGDRVLAGMAEVIRRTHGPARGFPAYFAVRTRFFDDEVLAAVRRGIRQVVTLAAGLDGRGVRLELPSGTRWFEVDLPEMTEFKDALLERSGLPLSCERRAVAADLREDWRSALRAAGFDPSRPTVWLVEGLLMYLTDEAGDAVLAGLSELSAPGSRVLVEHLKAAMLSEEGRPVREGVEEHGASWLSARDDLRSWLRGHGWQAQVYSGDDPGIGHGRAVAPLPACWLATATLTPPAGAPAG
ncbi:SAM-dependent methyltransferase [Streptomyces lucensis]|uniref:SAM-dependent methyltransferase n=1 Tax=Streptomyces lucensis TaxID=67319 RepID=UPI001E62FD8A|nr:SAM-dependent methyltransferase [Streptomyces lucensis]